MNIEEFTEIVKEIKDKRPVWFGLESDSPSTDFDINEIEKALSLKLPKEYKEFIKKFGGGYFAFTNIFSGRKESDWYIVTLNNEINLLQSERFLAISDNGSGDYYGYRVVDGDCESEISFFDHEENRIKPTKYKNLFIYIIKIGLSPTR